ncbi:protein adenylyltransferase SelO [Aureliella helgolandensis]|nr:YdiU family protein [Aureliella helgolandensis]
MNLKITDRFNQELPADESLVNQPRQVSDAAFSFVTPRHPSAPNVLHRSLEVARLIGLNEEDLESDDFVEIFSGAKQLPGTKPYAMCYGGHQFGSWAGQLGDGRAINLMEVEHAGKHWTLQLKGAGATPYSRTADGLAVLRSSLREHLCSEAMYHLGIPTNRSLCLISTGDQVVRDVLYDGHPRPEPGAIVCRVAPSFIRFGSFEILASRNELKLLEMLADYTIRHFFPKIDGSSPSRYVDFFSAVCQSTIEMVLHWQRVGFVHGVMNTDNMSIHGETIDYGPYGWLEGFDSDWTPNTTDRSHRRYRFGNQPQIALWNLVCLANALYPIVREAAPLQAAMDQAQADFNRKSTEMQLAKLGVTDVLPGDGELIAQLQLALQAAETDMTLFYRLLGNCERTQLESNPSHGLEVVQDALYEPDQLSGEVRQQWQAWFLAYGRRLGAAAMADDIRRRQMNGINPKYVLRNYMAQLAIDAAEEGDNALIEELHRLLTAPYEEQPESERWFAKRPDWARHKVGCSMLSCSS